MISFNIYNQNKVSLQPLSGLLGPNFLHWWTGSVTGASLLPVFQFTPTSFRAGTSLGKLWTHQSVFLLTLVVEDTRSHGS